MMGMQNMGPMPQGHGGPPMPQVMAQQPGTPQGQPGMPQPGIPQPGMAQNQERLDNISKVKSLIGQLRETLNVALKTAAHTLHQNSLVDLGTSKGLDVQAIRFDKSLEEFYSICDQIELHLKTSIDCLNQGASSQRYLSMSVLTTRPEAMPNPDMSSLTYPQFLATVRSQVTFAKEIHDMLLNAAQTVASTE